jgi:heme/copper-type cytochrome/quinol oxidase subunit 2
MNEFILMAIQAFGSGIAAAILTWIAYYAVLRIRKKYQPPPDSGRKLPTATLFLVIPIQIVLGFGLMLTFAGATRSAVDSGLFDQQHAIWKILILLALWGGPIISVVVMFLYKTYSLNRKKN